MFAGMSSEICGFSAWKTPLSTAPMSPSVSVTVFWSCSKNARWTSRTPFSNTDWKTLPLTRPPTTLSISGRNATRSARAWITTSSVTRVAISDETASSSSAAVARWANSSASRKVSLA